VFTVKIIVQEREQRRCDMAEGPNRPTDQHPDPDEGSRSLWFQPPTAVEDRRPALTRERVVAEALTIIAQDGVAALTMRGLAARLGVVPGALYRHVRNKEQLQDLVLDGVLAEVDCDVDGSQPWTERLKVLAHRLREVLEGHPGVAGLLQLRDPLGPHSLAVAEAFLEPLQTAGFAKGEVGPAFFLIIDYTTGFAVSSPHISTNQQRVRDATTRSQLHQFFRSLPTDRFPVLATLGEHVWVDNRDQRFTTGFDILVDGLKRARRAPDRRTPSRRPANTSNTQLREAAQQAVDGQRSRKVTR
jgi:AcrR family transcriptional regulator